MTLDRKRALALMFFVGHQKSLIYWRTTRHISAWKPDWANFVHHVWRVDIATGISCIDLSNVDPIDRQRGYYEGELVCQGHIKLPSNLIDQEMRWDLNHAASALRTAVDAAQVKAAEELIAGLAELES